ncbi:SAM domain-containing protein, partial [Salmonella sp. SAL4438]|uniref:SAM domain-containing protein n=1 Tax=Salmonella sp. SAL4438 TaxID=3159893 RepID=UPI00397817D1
MAAATRPGPCGLAGQETRLSVGDISDRVSARQETPVGIFDVAAWLEGLGLARYAPALAEHGIDGEALAGLTDHELTAIGVLTAVDRQRI